MRRWESLPDHAREVSRRLNILTDAEVARSLLKEGVLRNQRISKPPFEVA